MAKLELGLNCSHCEMHLLTESGRNVCLNRKKELAELTPCLDFKMRQAQPNEYLGLITAMIFSFIQPQKQPVSEEILEKAKFLAKAAKAQMDKGGKFEIKEGSELYEDTELFNAYCTELSKLITIDSLNRETAKVAEIKKITSYANGLPKNS